MGTGAPDNPLHGKSQLAIGFLTNADTDPLDGGRYVQPSVKYVDEKRCLYPLDGF